MGAHRCTPTAKKLFSNLIAINLNFFTLDDELKSHSPVL